MNRVKRFFIPTPKELGLQDSSYEEIIQEMESGEINDDRLPKHFSKLVRQIIEREAQLLRNNAA